MEGMIPDTLRDALSALNNKRFIPIAGGTDVMVRYKRWKNLLPGLPYEPLFIGHLKELKGIEKNGDEITIKAATPLSEIEHSDIVPFILKHAIIEMAAPAIRNMATIGGNIVNSSPAGDTLPPLYVLDAKITLISQNGRRCLYIYEFIDGPGKNKRMDNELLYEIKFRIPKYTHTLYRKVGTRKANALSKLSICALALIEKSIIKDFRVSFGAVSPTPVRIKGLEEKITGLSVTGITNDTLNGIVNSYSAHIKPIDDQRSTAEYRKKVSLALLCNFLRKISGT